MNTMDTPSLNETLEERRRLMMTKGVMVVPEGVMISGADEEPDPHAPFIVCVPLDLIHRAVDIGTSAREGNLPPDLAGQYVLTLSDNRMVATVERSS